MKQEYRNHEKGSRNLKIILYIYIYIYFFFFEETEPFGLLARVEISGKI